LAKAWRPEETRKIVEGMESERDWKPNVEGEETARRRMKPGLTRVESRRRPQPMKKGAKP